MKNKIIVFTGPSGVGKATVEKIIMKDNDLPLDFSVSATTRNPRKGEIDGKSYHFIKKEEFDVMIKNNELLEWSNHFENKYGTLKSEITRIHSNGKIPLLEIETNGALQIFKNYDNDKIISIFLDPPTLNDLEKRIKNRNSETEEQINNRLKKAKEEMKLKNLFNYVVTNEIPEETAAKIKEIILKEVY
ncbi:MAG: guanylate kinase [Mycoplasma sp.]|nr:guanylate kinase [Mycoplasma sp.]